MQEAIPYRTYIHGPAVAAGNTSSARGGGVTEEADTAAKSVEKMLVENAVLVLGRPGCCMCHVVKTLLLGHGVNPAVFEVADGDEAAVLDELSRIDVENGGGIIQFPAVFVGGKLLGGLDRVMATHISGDLVPILKEAGALWL